jgi:hypothetical protein
MNISMRILWSTSLGVIACLTTFAQDADSLRPAKLDTLSDRAPIVYDAKVYLEGRVVRGVMVQIRDGEIMMDTGEKIPVAQIKKIRLYRHIYGKTVTAAAAIGFVAGFVYFYFSRYGNDSAVAFGFIAAIPCAAVGAVVGLFVMPFFKYRFVINGSEENLRKMMKRVGVGSGKDVLASLKNHR